MTRESRSENRDSTGRSARVPLGVPRNKMVAPSRRGYVRRWINDEDNRLELAQNAGYSFVMDKPHVGESAESGDTNQGSRTSMLVGTHENGSPMHAYLMEIKKDWYDEDQIEKLKPVDEIDNAIRKGRHGENQDGRYIPKSGIKIS